MDSELRSVVIRYGFVAAVLAGAVMWAAMYTTSALEAQGGMSVNDLRPGTPTPRQNAAAGTSGQAPPGPTTAPSLASLLVVREGTTRVACEPACRLEAYCGFRSVEMCSKKSCNGDLRTANASDLVFARADTCVQAAAAPCEEACARRGVCGGTHNDDARCTDACLKDAARDPARAYREARCVLESPCSDVAGCSER